MPPTAGPTPPGLQADDGGRHDAAPPGWVVDHRVRKSWWGRHWKWVVPVGVLVPVVFCGGIFTLIVAIAFGVLKHTDPYTQAVARARADAEVTAALGSPIDEGFLVSGNFEVSGHSGHADLAIPISGPNGSGTVYLVAERSAGTWAFTTLEVAVEGRSESIDLLAGP
ncbi:MAG: cytochrome c oxidase assembly factor Coa1 family protein [Planctomycetota bacterium]